jgi:hypothetical protein
MMSENFNIEIKKCVVFSLWIGYFQIVSEMFGAVWPWFGRFFPPIRILSLTALVLDHLFTLVAFGLGDPYFWILILSCFLWINPIFSQGVLNTFLMTHLFGTWIQNFALFQNLFSY